MKIIEQGYKILTEISQYGMYELMDLERVARTCYRSEDKIKDQAESAEKLLKNLIKNGHEAMLEHGSISVEFTCDRAIANELVRHRLASFAQESTRYCNYSKDKFGHEISVINPGFAEGTNDYTLWKSVCTLSEATYLEMTKYGAAPEMARSVLPLSLATKIVVTANYREWRHIFKLRTAKDAHPQIRKLLTPLLEELKERIPIIFDDIGRTTIKEIAKKLYDEMPEHTSMDRMDEWDCMGLYKTMMEAAEALDKQESI